MAAPPPTPGLAAARLRRLARARKSQEGPDEDDQMEIGSQLTEEDKANRAMLEEGPMLAEVKHLEKRWTKKQTAYYTEPKEDEEVPAVKINWYEKFALCVTRHYNTSNSVMHTTTLHINSPALKDILARVIDVYPGQSFHTKDVTINFPARCLYHFRPELNAALKEQEPGTEGAAHLPVLLGFIDDHFADTIRECDNLRENGLVSYTNLWTIFRPGTHVYQRRMDQPRAYRLASYSYVYGDNPALQLSVQYVDYDGENFGHRSMRISIPAFSGIVPVTELSAFPLNMHPDADVMTHRLVQRGRHWESYTGQQLSNYKGIAIGKSSQYSVDSRVMIDTRTFHRIQTKRMFTVDPFPNPGGQRRRQSLSSEEWDLVAEDDRNRTYGPLTDDQCLVASPMTRGFSFAEKQFLDFFVDHLSPIIWNTRCFEQLVLPDEKKEIVQALVAEHTQPASSKHAGFDDIVKGKGLGLILVLHGPPGSGKTLTAECVAEFSRRPLYIVSSGDLGSKSSVLDERLSRTLDLASTWKAVLLIDEADVFLERRTLGEMKRNSLVSTFLRTLEYYSGILLMTTNRVRTFDDAFKSRIHVPIRYDNLDANSRAKVWKNFLGQLEGECGGVDIDEAGYQKLAESPLNGRQIKNVVRTAKSLAAFKKRKLDREQLEHVIQIQLAFGAEFDSPAGEDAEILEV